MSAERIAQRILEDDAFELPRTTLEVPTDEAPWGDAQPRRLGRPRGSRNRFAARRGTKWTGNRAHESSGPARFAVATVNRKLAPIRLEPTGGARERPVAIGPFVSSTSVSIGATCPSSCAFKGRGCYAQTGFTAKAQATMDEAARALTPLEVIRDEVSKVDGAFGGGRVPRDGARGGRDLRLHVGGDVPNARGALELGLAASRWRARGGGAVWTFTHRWREIRRAHWGKAISVLASCETERDVLEADAAGYAPALTVERFRDGAKTWLIGNLKVIPCPYETRQRTCAECRLCLDRDLHGLGLVIAFQLHGPGKAGR